MAQAQMDDAVKALETIRNWTQGVYAELSAYATSMAQSGQAVDPTLTSAIEAVDAAIKAVGQAATAAGTVDAVLDNPTLPNPDKGKIKGAVSQLSSRVGKGC